MEDNVLRTLIICVLIASVASCTAVTEKARYESKQQVVQALDNKCEEKN